MKRLTLLLLLLGLSIKLSYSVGPDHEMQAQTISKLNLWKTITELDIKHPEVVFAQALLETGNFTSRLFKQNNNLFGMRVPSKRSTVAKNVKNKKSYAKYSTWQESVVDYALYQDYVFKKRGELSRTKYYSYLDGTYCESTGYSVKLKKIIQKNQHILKS